MGSWGHAHAHTRKKGQRQEERQETERWARCHPRPSSFLSSYPHSPTKTKELSSRGKRETRHQVQSQGKGNKDVSLAIFLSSPDQVQKHFSSCTLLSLYIYRLAERRKHTTDDSYVGIKKKGHDRQALSILSQCRRNKYLLSKAQVAVKDRQETRSVGKEGGHVVGKLGNGSIHRDHGLPGLDHIDPVVLKERQRQTLEEAELAEGRRLGSDWFRHGCSC
ncbi:MAG: hypothetical protein J3R72DRAFT_247963 [Linnemannia gamsii]|nr:MAG: hypothetical protein J3R72DRAFT_247963 [Linnemannia gamsii]